jgi:hypothetical protein
MRTHDALIVTVERGTVIEVVFNGELTGDYDMAGELPLLTDAATLGAIEHGLLLEALPPCWHMQTHWTREGDGALYLHNADCEGVFVVEGVTRAEALVSALEFLSSEVA